jgi:hypothetical protein
MNMAARAASRGPRWRAWIIAALRGRLSECRMMCPNLGRTPDESCFFGTFTLRLLLRLLREVERVQALVDVDVRQIG